MTVVTQAISEKKLHKQPLVSSTSSSDVEAAAAAAATTATAGQNKYESPNSNESNNSSNIIRPTALLVRVNRSRSRNVQNLTTTCVLLGAVFVFCAGLLASFYWYQQYAKYRMRHYKGWCGIPYIEKISQEDMEKIMEMQPLYAQMKQELSSQPDTFYEEFDIDLEFGEYEKIDIPDFSKGRKGRFIHDFVINKTAIVDLDDHRCFVLDLNRSQVLPPSDLYDKITKIGSGYYEVNLEVIRETYSVVLPALEQNERGSLGYYIFESCYDFPIYKIEKIYQRQNSIVKRSTQISNRENTFVEFAGSQISKIEIPNISSAPGRRR